MTEEARKTAKAMHQTECEDCVFNPTKLGCRWRKKGMYCDTALHSAADLIESLSAQLEQVTRKRDAAVEDLKDAEPVRHGLWIRPTFDPAWVKCSECGCYWEGGIVENGNMYYCPSCGAKMDAEVSE